MVSDFFSGLAKVRPLYHEISKDRDSRRAAELGDLLWSQTYLAVHTFIGYYAHCEIVDRLSVIIAAHDFWSHVPWRPRSILRIVLAPDPRYPEVRDPQVPYI